MGDAEREIISMLINRLDLPRVFFTPDTSITDALPLILPAIVDRLEALERERE